MLTSRSFFYSDSTPSTLPGMMSPFAEISSSAPQTSPLKFKPLPSNSATCSKLKLNILLDSTIFVAGGEICGRLVIESKTDTDLLLGEIAVELNGFECT